MKLPSLKTERLIVRVPVSEDVPALTEYHRRNRQHLAPWSPIPPEHFFTEEFWRAKVEAGIDEYHLGISCRFFIFLRQKPTKVVGHIGFSQIFRGPFHACYLGYSVDGECEGKGYMREGIERAIQFVFEDLALHRIMANYIPHNIRSGNLLHRLGFVIEGYAHDYLQINGKWEDHVLTSKTNEKWVRP